MFFIIKHISNSMPTELSLTLEMSKEEVHDKIGNDFVLEKDKYEHGIEVYDLEWCGYSGQFSITYSASGDRGQTIDFTEQKKRMAVYEKWIGELEMLIGKIYEDTH